MDEQDRLFDGRKPALGCLPAKFSKGRVWLPSLLRMWIISRMHRDITAKLEALHEYFATGKQPTETGIYQAIHGLSVYSGRSPF